MLEEADGNMTASSGSHLSTCALSNTMAFAGDLGNTVKLWRVGEKLIGERFLI